MRINLITKETCDELPVVYAFTSFARSLFSSSSDARSFLSSASLSDGIDSIFSWLYTKKLVFPVEEVRLTQLMDTSSTVGLLHQFSFLCQC